MAYGIEYLCLNVIKLNFWGRLFLIGIVIFLSGLVYKYKI